MPATMTRRKKPGRPKRGHETPFETKVTAADQILVHRMPVNRASDVFHVSPYTLYAWIREVCASEYPAAPVFRALAAARGLIEVDPEAEPGP